MAIIIMVTLGVSRDMTPMNNSTWFQSNVKEIITETPTVKTFVLELPHDVSHLAGQHYEIRLTSEDGYQAARLYSAASPANSVKTLELTVALLTNGELSPYLHEYIKVGDQLEIRGPLGKFFVWNPEDTSPVLLIAGGSGVVPMRCILNAHHDSGSKTDISVLYSARSFEEIIYKDELVDQPNIQITLTDNIPDEWRGLKGRIDINTLKQSLEAMGSSPLCYVCGSTPFVEAMADSLLSLGVPSERIKTERFGGA